MPFARNVAARDYEFNIAFASTYSISDNDWGLVSEGEQVITWGNAYVAGTHGIRHYYKNYKDPFDASLYHIAELITPWGTTTVGPSAGWVASKDLQIQIDNETNVVVACESYTFAFNQLRWYIAGVLQTTIGAQSDSGVDWDMRLLICEHACDAFQNPIPNTNQLPCADTYAHQVTHNNEATAANVGGWRWRLTAGPGAWTEDDILFDLTYTLPAVLNNCTGLATICEGSLPSISGTKSNHISVYASTEDPITKADDGNTECPCPNPDPDHDINAIWHIWHGMEDYKHPKSVAYACPTNQGIHKRRMTRSANSFCDDDGSFEGGTTLTTDIESALTYSGYTRQTYRIKKLHYCKEIIRNASCALEGIGSYDPSDTDMPPCAAGLNSYVCVYDGYVSSTWPERPTCGCGKAHLTNTKTGVMLATRLDTTLQLWRFNFGSANEVVDIVTGVAINSAQVVVTPKGRINVAYEDAGGTPTVKLTESLAWGDTWSTPTTIAAGTSPAIAAENDTLYVALRTGGNWRCFRRKTPSEAWVNLATIVAAADGITALEFVGLESRALVFVANVGGTVKRYESFNKGESWTYSMDVHAGDKPAFAVDPHTGKEFVALNDANVWKCYRRGKTDTSFTFAGNILNASSEQAGLEFHPGDSHRLVFAYNGGNCRLTSVDFGATWA